MGEVVRRRPGQTDVPGMYSMICPRLELLEGPMAAEIPCY